MRKGLVVTILLIALSIIGAIWAYSPAEIDESQRTEASGTRMKGSALADSGTTRHLLGLWLLTITGTAAVLRARALRVIR